MATSRLSVLAYPAGNLPRLACQSPSRSIPRPPGHNRPVFSTDDIRWYRSVIALLMSSSTPLNVVWNNNLFDSEPVWAREPDPSVISTLARDHLGISESTPVSVNFFRQGAFNKLYTIQSPNLSKSYIFRVTLPVEPFYKTASEVATLSYLRHHTSIPVADVVAHSATTENPLGFEWILMECLPGVSLRDIWAKFPGDKESEETNGSHSGSLTASVLIPWEQKEEISRDIARYLLQLRKI